MKDNSDPKTNDLKARVKELEAKLSKTAQAEKKAESALREIENRYRSILDLSPDSIVIVDYKGVMIDANKRFCEWTGYTREEILASPAMRPVFLSLESRDRVIDIIKRRLSGEEVPPYELQIITKSGGTVLGEVHATVLYDSLGVALADLVVFREVTESKKGGGKVKEG